MNRGRLFRFGPQRSGDNAWAAAVHLSARDIIWTLGSISVFHRRAFDPELIGRDLPAPPLRLDTLIGAGRALGFRVKRGAFDRAQLTSLTLPCVVLLNRADHPEAMSGGDTEEERIRPALLVQISDAQALLFRPGTNQPTKLTQEELEREFTGCALQFALSQGALNDPDAARAVQRPFGFRWFLPEIVKHKRVWRDVLIASLFIQLLALGTPLFTQVIIDKVVVHRTQSTLAVIAIGMAVFTLSQRFFLGYGNTSCYIPAIEWTQCSDPRSSNTF